MTGKNILLPQSLPSFVEVYPNIINRLQSTGAFRTSAHKSPNHIIVNEYLPGQGIMDGPAYHPVVATISLGSHTVFHYYKYTSGTEGSGGSSDSTARVIDPVPVLSVFLEPRSAIITTGSLYTSHLHGQVLMAGCLSLHPNHSPQLRSIREVEGDTIIAGGNDSHPPKLADLNVEIANWRLLAGAQVKEAVIKGGTLQRGVRYSLTCRDVEKVASRAFLRR
ncbi:hypothetical protein D9757_008146 [Collybiopsis confluens]|uniref:Uncharacterized protein n=1 Tax=Collybiopsis confluens TaxID=2823264 RepID=A0A8H5M534_9AGAR|nr:hypothetical protein D9757_008146 [Collybiopsis confluens]